MKTPRKKLIDKLDKVAKDYIRARDGEICQHCHKPATGSNRHVSHVIPVSQGNRLRWDDQNMKILCYHCHINWWHKNPMEAAAWFEETYPDRWEYLQNNRGIAKFSQGDLEDMITKYKGRLDDISTV